MADSLAREDHHQDEGDALPADAAASAQTDVIPLDGVMHKMVKCCRLTIVEGPNTGRVLVSRDSRILIGTHDSADLKLEDRAVSRFHCEITLGQLRPSIRDLESSNGTFVGDVQIRSAYLKNGAILKLGRSRVRFEYDRHKTPVPVSECRQLGVMVGTSPATRTLFGTLAKAAQSEATVLLQGETGTGKEVAAESIHIESKRRNGPFVIIDCSEVKPELIESELFGHERGAFTGAVQSRSGAFENARGGTIFIDEIGELEPELQPRLLRALERRQTRRMGSNDFKDIDVRVIAATNRNLPAEIQAKRFRSDLYFRLAVVQIELPPLRERPDDIEVLVRRFLTDLDALADPSAAELLSEGHMTRLKQRSWPGNVRELRNYVERFLVFQGDVPADDGMVDQVVDGRSSAQFVNSDEPLHEARERWNEACEQRYLRALLERHADNVMAVARAAKVNRRYLYRLLKRHGFR